MPRTPMHQGDGRVVPTWPRNIRISPATIPPIFPPCLQPKRKRRKSPHQSRGRGTLGPVYKTREESPPSPPTMLLRPAAGGARGGVPLWQPPLRTFPPIILLGKTSILPGTRLLAVREYPGPDPIYKNSVVQMLLYYPVRSDPKKKR